MLRVYISDISGDSFEFKGMASSVALPGEDGEFSVLDFHQTLISCLGAGIIKIDEKPPIRIKKGIARMEGNELSILVER